MILGDNIWVYLNSCVHQIGDLTMNAYDVPILEDLGFMKVYVTLKLSCNGKLIATNIDTSTTDIIVSFHPVTFAKMKKIWANGYMRAHTWIALHERTWDIPRYNIGPYGRTGHVVVRQGRPTMIFRNNEAILV